MPEISTKINDRLARWIGIPTIALLVMRLSGFIKTSTPATTTFLLDFPCFIFISWILWNGNVLVHYALRVQLYRIKKIYFRLPARYGITVLFSWCASLVLLEGWNWALHNGAYKYPAIFLSQLIMTIFSFQISTFYEIVYLNKERESDLVQVERSETLRVQAQLDALKTQIDPHFIFNSLNTLSYLIIRDADKARLFNDTLANVYRYILSNKEKDLVLLTEELAFARNYFYLMRIRYPEGLDLVVDANKTMPGDYVIPPLSLQTLIENAVKHNYFSRKQPMIIHISITGQVAVITNNISRKQADPSSSRIGLVNLDKRYKLIVDRNIIITRDDRQFSVELPLLKW